MRWTPGAFWALSQSGGWLARACEACCESGAVSGQAKLALPYVHAPPEAPRRLRTAFTPPQRGAVGQEDMPWP